MTAGNQKQRLRRFESVFVRIANLFRNSMYRGTTKAAFERSSE
jgi:hypothetical protein